MLALEPQGVDHALNLAAAVDELGGLVAVGAVAVVRDPVLNAGQAKDLIAAAETFDGALLVGSDLVTDSAGEVVFDLLAEAVVED